MVLILFLYVPLHYGTDIVPFHYGADIVPLHYVPLHCGADIVPLHYGADIVPLHSGVAQEKSKYTLETPILFTWWQFAC